MTTAYDVSIDQYAKTVFPQNYSGTDLGALPVATLANQNENDVFIHGCESRFKRSVGRSLADTVDYQVGKNGGGLTLPLSPFAAVDVYVDASSTKNSYDVKIGILSWTKGKPYVRLYHEHKHAEGEVNGNPTGHWSLIPEVNTFRKQRNLGYQHWRL